jgi:hypothetical protein
MEWVCKGRHGAWAGLVFFFCTAFSIYSQNLVVNGNFETCGGSFAGWDIGHTINQTTYPYSGPTISTGGYYDPYYARFTAEQSGSGDILSQDIATIPGEVYDIDFAAEDGAGGNFETDFSFGNFTDNLGAAFSIGPGQWFTGWTNFNFLVTATELETELSFLIYADAGSEFGVDDISAVAVPQLQAAVVGSKFQMMVTNTSGPVIIQATTNMINWINVYTNTAPFTFTDPCKFHRCYYRAAIVSSGSE